MGFANLPKTDWSLHEVGCNHPHAHRGVIDEDIDPAKLLEGQFEQLLNVILGSDIAQPPYTASSKLTNLLLNGSDLIIRPRTDNETGAFPSKSQSDRSPDSSSGTRHNRYLIR